LFGFGNNSIQFFSVIKTLLRSHITPIPNTRDLGAPAGGGSENQRKKKTMMHSHSTSSRQPAIPAVGFLQGALVRPNVPDVADFECGPGSAPFIEARAPYLAYLRTDDRRHGRLRKLFDFVAAAFVVAAVAFGPAVTSLLAR
jgi:hypothetical protein